MRRRPRAPNPHLARLTKLPDSIPRPPTTPATGGEDLFVHQTAIVTEGFRSLRDGEAVEFVVETSEDGRQKVRPRLQRGGHQLWGESAT